MAICLQANGFEAFGRWWHAGKIYLGIVWNTLLRHHLVSKNNTTSLLEIKFEDVYNYILAVIPRHGENIVAKDLAEGLHAAISYAPGGLIKKLMDKTDNNQDLECALVVVKLLVNGLLPPSRLCASILAIFEREDGQSLTCCILASNTLSATTFEASLEITKCCAELHESSVLMNRIENLPDELIDWIIRIALFAKPFGSHDQLHTIRALSQERRHPVLQMRIADVFAISSTRENVYESWKVYFDVDHLTECASHGSRVEEKPNLDLPSWTMKNWDPCFKFLLTSKAVRASSSNLQGVVVDFIYTDPSQSWIPDYVMYSTVVAA